MNYSKEIVFSLNKSTKSEILFLLNLCDDKFIPPLSKTVNLEEYSTKLFDKAMRFEAYHNNIFIGLVCGYINKEEKNSSYITNVSIHPDFHNRGLASELLNQMIDYCRKNALLHIILEVNKCNIAAKKLYDKYEFEVFKENGDSLFMKKNLRKWKKLGHVFDPSKLVSKPTWLDQYAQAPNTLILDDVVRVYFSCRPKRDKNGQFVSYSAFLDLDKNELTKIVKMAKEPVLSTGSKGCFDEFGIYPFTPIKKDDAIWAYYGGWTRCVSVPFDVSLGVCVSHDGGESFKRIGNGPVLSTSLYEPFTVSSPKIRKFNDKYYLFYCTGTIWHIVDGNPEMALKIRSAVSEDGLNWRKLNKNIISDVLGDTESQASADVIYKNGKYHMFFDYWSASDFRKTKFRTIGYAYSTDLKNWTRDDKLAGIEISTDKNAFDNEMLAYPHTFEVNDKIYMLYLGNNVGEFGFGLAELEGDLF